MLVTAMIGMCTKFVEVSISHKYRDILPDGTVSGGPMYYLSKGLAAYGRDEFTKPDGQTFNWRTEFIKKMLSLQKTDEAGRGFWVNDVGRYWESDPVLVTAYALMLGADDFHLGLLTGLTALSTLTVHTSPDARPSLSTCTRAPSRPRTIGRRPGSTSRSRSTSWRTTATRTGTPWL